MVLYRVLSVLIMQFMIQTENGLGRVLLNITKRGRKLMKQPIIKYLMVSISRRVMKRAVFQKTPSVLQRMK